MKLTKEHKDTLTALSFLILFPAFCFVVVYGCLLLTPLLINLIK
jgi:hypothetical protein